MYTLFTLPRFNSADTTRVNDEMEKVKLILSKLEFTKVVVMRWDMDQVREDGMNLKKLGNAEFSHQYIHKLGYFWRKEDIDKR